MKGTFLLNMLAILAGLLGVMALSGVSLSESDSLYRLFVAALLFLGSWQLFARGLAAPAVHSARRHPACGQGEPPTRRAA